MNSVRAEMHEGVMTIVIDAPKNANAFSNSLLRDLNLALDGAQDAASCAIIFRSATNVFSAGLDLSDIDQVDDDGLRERLIEIETFLQRVHELPIVTLAVVDGPAIGAGADLVVVCDFRIGSSSARFAFPGVKFGLLLGTARLCRLVGSQNARDILIRDERLGADRALEIGLLSAIIETSEREAAIAHITDCARSLDRTLLRELLPITRGHTSAAALDTLRASISSRGIVARVRNYTRGQNVPQT